MATPTEQPDDEVARLTLLFDAQKRLRQAAADYASALDGFDTSHEQWTLACEAAARMARLPFLENLRPRPSRPQHPMAPEPLRLIEGGDE